MSSGLHRAAVQAPAPATTTTATAEVHPVVVARGSAEEIAAQIAGLGHDVQQQQLSALAHRGNSFVQEVAQRVAALNAGQDSLAARGRARALTARTPADAYKTIALGAVRGEFGAGFVIGLAEKGLLAGIADLAVGTVFMSDLVSATAQAVRTLGLPVATVAGLGGAWTKGDPATRVQSPKQRVMLMLNADTVKATAKVSATRAEIASFEEELNETLETDQLNAWLNESQRGEFSSRFRQTPRYQAKKSQQARDEQAQAELASGQQPTWDAFAVHGDVAAAALADAMRLDAIDEMAGGHGYATALQMLEQWQAAFPSRAEQHANRIARIQLRAFEFVTETLLIPRVEAARGQGVVTSVLETYEATVGTALRYYRNLEKGLAIGRAIMVAAASKGDIAAAINSALRAGSILDIGIVGKIMRVVYITESAALASETPTTAAAALISAAGKVHKAAKKRDLPAAKASMAATLPFLQQVKQHVNSAAMVATVSLIPSNLDALYKLAVDDQADSWSGVEAFGILLSIAAGFLPPAAGGTALFLVGSNIRAVTSRWRALKIENARRAEAQHLLSDDGQGAVVAPAIANAALSRRGVDATRVVAPQFSREQLLTVQARLPWLFAEISAETYMACLHDAWQYFRMPEHGGLQAEFYDFLIEPPAGAVEQLAQQLVSGNLRQTPRFFEHKLRALFAPTRWRGPLAPRQ